MGNLARPYSHQSMLFQFMDARSRDSRVPRVAAHEPFNLPFPLNITDGRKERIESLFEAVNKGVNKTRASTHLMDAIIIRARTSPNSGAKISVFFLPSARNALARLLPRAQQQSRYAIIICTVKLYRLQTAQRPGQQGCTQSHSNFNRRIDLAFRASPPPPVSEVIVPRALSCNSARAITDARNVPAGYCGIVLIAVFSQERC